MRSSTIMCLALLIGLSRAAPAQVSHDSHASMQSKDSHASMQSNGSHAPAQPGQAAYGAIAEVVRILEADPATDWTKVNIERLRRHLIDMDEVTMNARAEQVAVPGGARMTVTGSGATRDAIRRMAHAHAAQFGDSPDIRISIDEHPEGAVMTATAARAGDTATEAKIRALGFIGLMATGDHHGPHHLALAAGREPAGHEHQE